MNILEKKDPFADEAKSQGFTLSRSSGKHNIWRNSSGVQVTSPKTSSDWRAIKNFRAELRSKLRATAAKSQSQSTSKPSTQKPTASSASARNRYSSGQPVKTSNQQTTFKDFMNRVSAAKTPKPVSAPSKPSTATRMATAYSNLLRNLPSDEKVRLGNKTLSQITGRNFTPGSGYRTSSGVGLADSFVPEQMTAPKLMNKNMLDLRTTKEKQKEIDIPAKLLPYNPEIGNQYKTSQIAPSKTVVIDKELNQLPHMDLRGPGQKLRSIQLQKKFYDSMGKTPPSV